MKQGFLSQYFDSVAVKRLSTVEIDPGSSNQHEFAGGHLRFMFGTEKLQELPARFIWLGDEQEGLAEDSFVSWYDSREKQPYRSAEWRLYYRTNSIIGLAKEGDSFFVARMQGGPAMIIFAPKDSTIENQLLWLFGLEIRGSGFFGTDVNKEDARLDFAARYILDELGIDAEEPEADRLDAILASFGTKFPATREFSRIARESLAHVKATDDPDAVLMAWLEREELLFRRLERHVVADRLKAGFVSGDQADVDGFLSFSLSVQNRRKSRAGQSLENHLEALFSAHGIAFQRGVETENRNRPDFLFPSQSHYRDSDFPVRHLTMLGVKSTCKDRWRQVLTEAQRIALKHLLTLEPGISGNQTNQMCLSQLQLVLPAAIHETYKEDQRAWLMNVSQFVGLIQKRQLTPLRYA